MTFLATNSTIFKLKHLPDLQNRPLKSLRPQMHHSRNRKHWRASPNLPARGGLVAPILYLQRMNETWLMGRNFNLQLA